MEHQGVVWQLVDQSQVVEQLVGVVEQPCIVGQLVVQQFFEQLPVVQQLVEQLAAVVVVQQPGVVGQFVEHLALVEKLAVVAEQLVVLRIAYHCFSCQKTLLSKLMFSQNCLEIVKF